MASPFKIKIFLFRLKKVAIVLTFFVCILLYVKPSRLDYLASHKELSNDLDCPGNQIEVIDQIVTNKNKDHPLEFLSSSRNPCWYEYFNETHIAKIKKNDFIKTRSYTDIRYQMENLEKYLINVINSSSKYKNVRLRCLPSFNIVGQAKCGTTDLYQRLSLHPQVLMGMVKEPFWWSHGAYVLFDDYVELNDLAAAKIDKQLREAKCKNTNLSHEYVLGEGSVAMFSEQIYRLKGDVYNQNKQLDTPSFIQWVVPNTKIIIILRNPITRLYSDYIYFGDGTKVSPADFHNRTLQAIAEYKNCSKVHGDDFCANSQKIAESSKVSLYRGLYSVMLKIWLTAASKKNILVIRMEDYSKNMSASLQTVYTFLNLETPTAEQNKEILKEGVNNKGGLNIGQMFNATRQILTQFYKPYNEELASSILTIVEPSFLEKFLDIKTNYTTCSELPKIEIIAQLLLLSGPAYYHYSLTPTYNCSREYFSKTNNDLLDNSLTGFVMRGNGVFQINTIKAIGANWNVTYCNTPPPRKTNLWHVLTVKQTMKGTISCIYSCSNDGISLAEFKCGATTNDPDVIKQELPYVEMAKYIQSENANYKIFDAHSNCPNDDTCP
ncbi:Carbohydrate sulfotransferase 15 [Chamberlinius hualienensis]